MDRFFKTQDPKRVIIFAYLHLVNIPCNGQFIVCRDFKFDLVFLDKMKIDQLFLPSCLKIVFPVTCISASVAAQMKGSDSRKTRPSQTKPGAEAQGWNFNEINLDSMKLRDEGVSGKNLRTLSQD